MKTRPIKNTRFILKNGKTTGLLRASLEDVLVTYVDTSKFWAEKRKKNLPDYQIRDVFIVGSLLRGNDNSDLDLLLIASKIDQEDYRLFKQVLAQLFYINRPKTGAVDVFIRPYDEFPDRNSFEITSQVRDLLEKYNKLLS